MKKRAVARLVLLRLLRPVDIRCRCGIHRLEQLDVLQPGNQPGFVVIADNAELQLCLPQADGVFGFVEQLRFFLFRPGDKR